MMKPALAALGAAFSMTCVTAPCFAQDSMSFANSHEQRTGAYGGVNLRLEFGGQHRRPRPVARIALGSTQESRGSSGTAGPRRNALRAMELGVRKGGVPELFVAGQSTAGVSERLGIGDTRFGPLEIIFGVALIAVTILVVTSLDEVGDGL